MPASTARRRCRPRGSSLSFRSPLARRMQPGLRRAAEPRAVARVAAALPVGKDATGVATPPHLRRTRAAGAVEGNEGTAHPPLGNGPHARGGPLGAMGHDGAVRVRLGIGVDGPRVVLHANRRVHEGNPLPPAHGGPRDVQAEHVVGIGPAGAPTRLRELDGLGHLAPGRTGRVPSVPLSQVGAPLHGHHPA